MLAAAAVAPQAAVPQATIPQTAGTAADPDVQSALDQLKANTQAIAKVKLPMATEPAFHFKA